MKCVREYLENVDTMEIMVVWLAIAIASNFSIYAGLHFKD